MHSVQQNACVAHLLLSKALTWAWQSRSIPDKSHCAEATQPCSGQLQSASGLSATPGRPAMSTMCRQAASWQEATLGSAAPGRLCTHSCCLCARQQRSSRAAAACGYLVRYSLADVHKAAAESCHSRPKQVLAYQLYVKSRSSSASHCILWKLRECEHMLYPVCCMSISCWCCSTALQDC